MIIIGEKINGSIPAVADAIARRDCHGIGNDRSTEVNQLLDRGLVQDQVKQILIPLFVFPENFL